jgi:hypothetical protein
LCTFVCLQCSFSLCGAPLCLHLFVRLIGPSACQLKHKASCRTCAVDTAGTDQPWRMSLPCTGGCWRKWRMMQARCCWWSRAAELPTAASLTALCFGQWGCGRMGAWLADSSNPQVRPVWAGYMQSGCALSPGGWYIPADHQCILACWQLVTLWFSCLPCISSASSGRFVCLNNGNSVIQDNQPGCIVLHLQ